MRNWHLLVFLFFSAQQWQLAWGEERQTELWSGTRVCVVDNAWFRLTDGSDGGPWRNAPKNFKLELKTCDMIRKDAKVAFGLPFFHICSPENKTDFPKPPPEELLGEISWAKSDIPTMGSGISLRRGNQDMFGNLNWQFVVAVGEENVSAQFLSKTKEEEDAWFSFSGTCFPN